MKRALLIASIIAASLNGESMKLVHKETGHIMLEFQDDTVIFHNWFLEKEIGKMGIFIPPIVRTQFGGKEVIFANDPLFKKAFTEVYCRFELPTSSYEWQPPPTSAE